ncbi:MAG: DUF6273 domain-containing protein [Bacteroidales bacterium]|nr:DUF6273 domain-containing protein [Bacteroidales bacterium]
MADEVLGNTAVSKLEELHELADSGDYFYVVGADGSSKKMQASEMFWQMANFVGSHNSLYRGQYLGDHLSDEQWAEIKAGTFKDMFIGDYWTINGFDWVIADFNYWLGTGDSGYDLNDNHIVIVPSTMLYYDTVMNTSNTTTGGYIGSDMYANGLTSAKGIVNNAFGSDHVLNHREYLSNAVTSGYPSGGEWVDSTVELMNEEMVYGSIIRQQSSSGGTNVNNATNSKSQLSLFRFNQNALIAYGNGVNGGTEGTRYTWWLRDVVSAANFATVTTAGLAYSGNASNTYGVRPCFAIY